MLTEYLLNRPVVTPPARSAERSGRVMGTPESSPAFPASEGFAEENQSISGSRESGFTSQAWELSLSPEALEKARQMQSRLQGENDQKSAQNTQSGQDNPNIQNSDSADSSEIDEEAGKTSEDEQTPQAGESPSEQKLSEEEKQEVQELKKRDAEVRAHEQAHVAAAGGHAMGGPKYEYETGPDQKRYAKSGHVNIDTSKEDSPEATLQKAKTVERAAMAPAEPSPQDLKVAAKARKMAMEAQQELNEEKQTEVSKQDEVSKQGDATEQDDVSGAVEANQPEQSNENSTSDYSGNETLKNPKFQSAAAAYASFSATPLSGGIDLAA